MAHFIPCRKSMNAEQLADLMAKHDDWALLLATAEFAYNNNNPTSTGVSSLKANYGFNPSYSRIPLAGQCVPAVAERLRQLAEVQDELKHCLEAAQETMKSQFNRGVRKTPEWNSGDEVWLDGRNILTTRPRPKLEHRWLGPFPIASRISTSAYKLTLPLSMQGVHPVFHVSVLCKHKPNEIAHQQRRTLEPVTVNGGDEWEVDGILESRRRGRTTQYLVSWRGFGPAENSWELEANLKNSRDLLAEFKSKFPEAAARHWRTRRRK
ncbi:hypothetical protein PtB15_11B246 [Puccinia triticina]|nr:hypothetical protein PtB15_11B241 [Puccinia triticina]WAR59604.1 hypothetical protein PtB15_11B244 [Puccinia triticina]WAR59606.1 hypothetical protein PtB15_11B246 [Puccinia triticina]